MKPSLGRSGPLTIFELPPCLVSIAKRVFCVGTKVIITLYLFELEEYGKQYINHNFELYKMR